MRSHKADKIAQYRRVHEATKATEVKRLAEFRASVATIAAAKQTSNIVNATKQVLTVLERNNDDDAAAAVDDGIQFKLYDASVVSTGFGSGSGIVGINEDGVETDGIQFQLYKVNPDLVTKLKEIENDTTKEPTVINADLADGIQFKLYDAVAVAGGGVENDGIKFQFYKVNSDLVTKLKEIENDTAMEPTVINTELADGIQFQLFEVNTDLITKLKGVEVLSERDNIQFQFYEVNTDLITKLQEPEPDPEVDEIGGVNDYVYELDETQVVEDFRRFITSNAIKTICNVYQEKYSGGKRHATGFGDYIRGCYFLVQFCQYIKFKYNIEVECDFWINHAVASCLASDDAKNTRLNTKLDDRAIDITVFDNQNWKGTYFDANGGITIDHVSTTLSFILSFMNYLIIDALLVDDAVYAYTIAFPICTQKIYGETRARLRNILTPSRDIRLYISGIKRELGLAVEYSVIHIRMGDKYLFVGGSGGSLGDSGSNDQETIKKLLNHVRVDISGKATKWLVISDNNAIKDAVCEVIGQEGRAVKYDIGHLGEGQLQNAVRVRNTMTDFFLLSGAVSIISYTTYAHGSGFSRWCAETFGIPYSCHFIG